MKTHTLSFILVASLAGVLSFSGCGGGGGGTTSSSSSTSNDPSVSESSSSSSESSSSSSSSSSTTRSRRVVLQTEQVDSIDRNGKTVKRGELFDDGFYQSGTTRSYNRDARNGIVVDKRTGLEWQDNALPKKDNFANAVSECANLDLDGKGWRLPEIEELNSISSKGKFNPAINAAFNQLNVDTNDYYWSNTKFSANSDLLWAVQFEYGEFNSMQPDSDRFIRCVRGNTLKATGDYQRNNTTNEVTDTSTGLIWQDDGDTDANALSWEDSLNYCKNKGKFVTWRTPSIEELFSLIDRLNEIGVSEKFINLDAGSFYWSSTTIADPGFLDFAWGINFPTLNPFAQIKTGTADTICVRDQ